MDPDSHGVKGVPLACLAVVAGAAIASGPLTSRTPLVGVAIGIGVVVCALLAMRALRIRFRQEAEFRRSIAEAATARERRRIARDLHDGLAQDLAFIAAHGDRLAVEKGAEYPLAVAARRALAVSRGAIAELSAAHAATIGDALTFVAEELGGRFGIQVEVRAEPRAVAAVPPSDREHFVRIAREAIVNAARHGHARKVIVSLAHGRHQLVLTVRDDGVGMGAGPARSGGGFGLVSMRERTTTLGGRLTTRTPAAGGTEVELVVPLSGSPIRSIGRSAA